MIKSIENKVKLHNGVEIPQFGLGVYKVEEGQTVIETVKAALSYGYRSIDTAAVYGNEEGVGKAIKESAISREELFITTKLWNDDQGYDQTLKAFETSLRKLDLDYIDLYLIHWPGKDKYVETWKAFERLYDEGLVRAIGVSNFHEHHLEQLLKNANEHPAVNQIELHPRLSQEALRDYCKSKDIKVEAWSPLAKGRLLNEPTINYIANKHGKTPAQVILRWHLQNDIIVIPKSITPARLKENADIFDFQLSLDEMNQLDQLNMNERTGSNPDNLLF
ncbi:aldo/keto reductase [Niallia sp. NCCP-28]|uniref:aldo/keto reductase n=1 Tax=Niallia sp. NCCP-28 TaxID=2934712 RepID=UPI00208557B2|nr:aldo/keto reductase [Niallia sp. NCCP-28]GKU81633.1 glyoxal reductase [Niallia sp. NCCP-28]